MWSAADEAPAGDSHENQGRRAEGVRVWYVVIFSGLAILLVVVVLIRNARVKAARSGSGPPTGATNASHTAPDDAAHRERKRRRAQSRDTRRKRH